MINIKDKAECCGCTACASICSHNAITMKPDVMGFMYPHVDESKCTDCGLCDKVCSFADNYDTSFNLDEPFCYGARHKDISQVETSRSGASFIAISDYILSLGGVIYGAGYTDHFRVVHKRATTPKDRDEFKGSKYVQSDLNTVFRQVKEDLNRGLSVLFTGTPCQTSGLRSYVGKRLTENLYLVDIICHGVPAPNIWRDYITYLEEKYGAIITEVNFRNKNKFGWKDHKESFKFNNGSEIATTLYTSLFYRNLMFRYSCGKCHFTNTKRPSDITLGDFWGWEKTNATANIDDKGLSLILCNTEKGKRLFDTISQDICYFPAALQDCLQSRLEYPVQLSKERDGFEAYYKSSNFKKLIRRYKTSSSNILVRIIRKICRLCQIKK